MSCGVDFKELLTGGLDLRGALLLLLLVSAREQNLCRAFLCSLKDIAEDYKEANIRKEGLIRQKSRCSEPRRSPGVTMAACESTLHHTDAFYLLFS